MLNENRRYVAKSLLICLLLSGVNHAQALTWNGTTDASWGTAANWSTGVVPALGNATSATFSNAGNGNTIIDLSGAARSSFGLNFSGATTPSYTLNNSTLQLLANAGTPYAIDISSTMASSVIINSTLTVGTNSGTFVFNNNGASSLQINSNLTGRTGATGTNLFVLQGTSTSLQNEMAGIISNNASPNVVSLTKAGTGVWTLSAANTYTGATTISAGTLLVNGSLASGSAVTVNSTGTLGGGGVINGATTIASGAFLNAGSSAAPQDLTFAGTLSLSGTTSFDLSGTARGTSYDAINTNAGLLTLGGALTLNFGAAAASNVYDLFNIGVGGETGSFSSVALGGLYSGSLTNTSGIWNGSNGGFNFTFAESTGDLTVSAVPEPSTFALLGLGLGSFWVLRRRKAA